MLRQSPHCRKTVLASGLLLLSLAAGSSEALLYVVPGKRLAKSYYTAALSRNMCLFSKKATTQDEAEATSSKEQPPSQDDNGGAKDDKIKALTWNPLRLGVMRLGLTEPAMTSPLNYGKYDGTFSCAYCGAILFDSNAKYDSGTGWPSFWRTAVDEAVAYKRDLTGLECHCSRCDSHLGHVFLDGPRPASVPASVLEQAPASDPRGRADNAPLPRYCINGAALNYKERKEQQQ